MVASSCHPFDKTTQKRYYPRKKGIFFVLNRCNNCRFSLTEQALTAVSQSHDSLLAEKQGFEPWLALQPLTVFETVPFNRLGISPGSGNHTIALALEQCKLAVAR